jgi:hypothetical protein
MNEILELTQEQKEEFDKLYSNVTTNGGKMLTEDAQDILSDASRLTLDDIKQLRLEICRREQI